MNENEYKSNSFKSKELANKNLQPVVTGEVVTKKRSVFRKFTDALINQNIENAKEYIVFDIVVPAIKNTFSDALISIVEMIFGTRRTAKPGSTTTSYTAYYNKKNGNTQQPTTTTPSTPYLGLSKRDFDEVIVETRWEAEDVIDHLTTAILEYGSVSIADFYELVGIQSSFTDNKYGWTNLSTATVERVGGGYLIKLPPTVKLD